MHAQQATDALAISLGRVQRVATRFQRAGIHPQVGQLADMRIGLNLEDQTRERLARLDRANDFLVVLRIDAGDRWNIVRRGKEADDRIEHRLNALVLQRRAAQDRHELTGKRRGSESGAQLVGRELFVIQVAHHHLFVGLGNELDQMMARLGSRIDHIGRNVGDLDVLAEIVVIDDGVVLDQIDHTQEVRFSANRQAESEPAWPSGDRRSSRAYARTTRRCGPSY